MKKSIFPLVACATVVGGLAVASPFAAKQIGESLLHKNGFPVAQIEGLSLYPNGITIDLISLDANEFSTIEDMQIGFSWFHLLSGRRIDSLSATSIAISGEIDEASRLTIAGWDATFPEGNKTSFLLPVQKLALEKITLDLETPQGSLRTEGKVSLQTPEGGQKQSWQASLHARQKQLSFAASLSGNLFADGHWTLNAEVQDGDVDIPSLQLSRLTGWIDAGKSAADKPPTYAGQIAAGRVNIGPVLFQNPQIAFDTAKSERIIFEARPSGFPDIAISGKWTDSPVAPIDVSFFATKGTDIPVLFALSDEKKKVLDPWLAAASPINLNLKTSFDDLKPDSIGAAFFLKTGSASAELFGNLSYDKSKETLRLNLPEATLSAEQISSLLPKETTKASLASGILKFWGAPQIDFSTDPVAVTGPLALDLQGASGTWNNYPFEGLSGQAEFSSLIPWEIKTPAAATLTRIATGTPITDVATTFSGSHDKGLSVGAAKFGIGGGKAELTAFSLQKGGSARTELSVSGVDLRKLSAGFGDFQAEGTLSGKFPIEIADSGVLIKSGKIESVSEGSFRYAPDKFPAALQGDDPRMKTVREALSDFHFTALSLSLDGALNGELKTTLNAEGTNPAFGERPIQLNLNLEGDLAAALRQALQPGKLPDTLLKTGE